MRAAIFHQAGQPLSISNVSDPTPGPGEIVIAVSRAGICGSDLHVTQHPGIMPDGLILGHEFAGTVAATGEGVAGLKCGMRVTALPLFTCRTCEACEKGLPSLCAGGRFIGNALDAPGAYAEYVRVRADFVQRVPDGVNDTDAGMIEPLAVGHHVVGRAELRRDDCVLIIGGGPIGAAVTLFARAAGAQHVIVSEPSAPRAERCALIGATATIDPSQEDVVQRFEALAGRRPSVVFECVGLPGMLDLAVRLAGLRGRVIVAGVVFSQDSFAPLEAMAREISIIYSQAYEERDFAVVIDALAAGKIDAAPMHTRTVGFADLPPVFEALRGNPLECKVLIDPQA